MKKGLLIVLISLVSFSMAKADEGMWLLSLLKKYNIEDMQRKGFKLTAEDIYSINRPGIKDAIVGLGKANRPFAHFCSAEIVSDKGLMFTNHHCGFEAIQEHSSVEHDYLKDGFWAMSLSEELANPGVTASILERMEDVTDQVLAVLTEDMTEEERAKAVDAVSRQIIGKAVAGTRFMGQVQSMFNGNQYFLLLYTIYRDVRLVAAPPQSIGKFGGDTDNWMWPRHTGDFSMLRVYTAPDGSPAPYSPANVPLKPKHHLPVSLKGVANNDFAMIMGFPGTTDRYTSSFGLQETMDFENHIRYVVRTEKLRVMKEGMDKDDKVRIQYAAKYAQSANYWKYSFEQNKALKALNVIEEKREIERKFVDWLNASSARKTEYGEVLSMLETAYAKKRPLAKAQNYMFEALLQGPETPMFALNIASGIEALGGSEYSDEQKEMLKKNIEGFIQKFYKDFDADIDTRLYAVLLKMYSDNVEDEYQPDIIKHIRKKFKGNFDKFATTLHKKTIFHDPDKLKKFMEAPDMKVLNKDLAYITGKSIFELYNRFMKETEEINDVISKGNRLFLKGLMEMNPDKVWSPDANSTIRLTYGNVKSYEPKDGVEYKYYTTLKGVMDKENPASDEFKVSPKLKELYRTKDFGPYGKDGKLNVCFLTDNDITGGNSGSGVIDGEGNLIGIAFDGNSEAMSGDIHFETQLQRCINVDIRYVLFVIDKFAGAKHLIDEMTIVK